MPAEHFDVVVVGAGIAGASAAWALAQDHQVLLVEREHQPGLHATGRSAAVMSETSGTRATCALAGASRAFFESPPPGFVEYPLVAPRGLVWVGGPGDEHALASLAITGATQSSCQAGTGRSPRRLCREFFHRAAIEGAER